MAIVHGEDIVDTTADGDKSESGLGASTHGGPGSPDVLGLGETVHEHTLEKNGHDEDTDREADDEGHEGPERSEHGDALVVGSEEGDHERTGGSIDNESTIRSHPCSGHAFEVVLVDGDPKIVVSGGSN